MGLRQARQALYDQFRKGVFAPYGIATIDLVPEKAYVPDTLRINILPAALFSPDSDELKRRIGKKCKTPFIVNVLATLDDYCERYQTNPTRNSETTKDFLKYVASPDDPFFFRPFYRNVEVFHSGNLATRLDFVQTRSEPPVIAQVQVVDDEIDACLPYLRQRNALLERARSALAPRYGTLQKMRIEGYHNGIHWETRTDLNSRLYVGASFK